jgi:hypothetical protein
MCRPLCNLFANRLASIVPAKSFAIAPPAHDLHLPKLAEASPQEEMVFLFVEEVHAVFLATCEGRGLCLRTKFFLHLG